MSVEVERATQGIDILGIDYVEFYVGNARQWAQLYRLLGFEPVGYRGLETGARDMTSWCLRSGDIRFVFTGTLTPGNEVAEHVRMHGDGIRDIAFRVADAGAAFETMVSGGAAPARQPAPSENGNVTVGSIRAFGDTLHSFVSRDNGSTTELPGFEPIDADGEGDSYHFDAIDHVAIAVELGGLREQIEFYRRLLDFTEMDLSALNVVSTDYSALMSKVVEDGTGKIKFPILEPAEGRGRSQVDEFLEYYCGPGVQHLALLSDDLVAAVDHLRAHGFEMLRIPDSYYDEAADRVPEIADYVEDLRRNSILADKDEDGYLLQAFSKPVQDRPTFFLELIERHGSRGFGRGNVKSLFQALEREQAARGNL